LHQLQHTLAQVSARGQCRSHPASASTYADRVHADRVHADRVHAAPVARIFVDSSECMPASEAVKILVDAEVNNGLSPDMEARKRLCLALSSSCLRSLSEGSSRSLFSRSASTVVSLLPVGAPPFFILATAQHLGVSIASATAHTGTSQRKGTVQIQAHTQVQGHHRSSCTPRMGTRGSLLCSATHWTPISHFFSLPARVQRRAADSAAGTLRRPCSNPVAILAMDTS
jgi:hypothetical protein